MTTSIHKSALVAYTPAEMYALVSDIEAYPEFLPWTAAARIRDDVRVQREAEVAWRR